MEYTDEFLILELQRFYYENNRVSTLRDMTKKNGYPSVKAYENHFGSWNNALELAGLKINKVQSVLDGTETCSYCGKKADEIPNFTSWLYDENEVRYCRKHGQGSDYVIGNLDINSSKGLGRAGEILVVKTLKIGNEYDCNRISCGYSFDMYHEKYGKIDVKTSLLGYEHNSWFFNLTATKEVKTYICIGLSSDRKKVDHVWIVPNEDKIRYQQGLQIIDSPYSLSTHEHWEVDVKSYNDVWQTMKLKTCNSMVDKSKPKVTRTWEETLKALAKLNKKYGVKSSV